MLDIEDSIGRLPPQIDVKGSVDDAEKTSNNTVRFFNVRTKRRRKWGNGSCSDNNGGENDDAIDENGGGFNNNNCTVDDGTALADAVNGLASVLPWNKQVYLRTWGCSHNNSDSEYMAGLLLNAGFRVTADRDAADVWLLNSCTVKTPSETQLENEVRRAKAERKRVVVAGCVSQAAPSCAWLRDVSVIGVQQIDKIVSVVEETVQGNNVRVLSKRRTGGASDLLDLAMPKMRRNEFIEILAINSGCLNHCTYCKTKAARGDLRSFPLEALVQQARKALTLEGCRELWLTSEDLGAWGRDIGLTIPDLLRALVKIVPDGCMMRLGMTNPPYILDHLEEIADILRHPRVYAFLHIPVQSGSDAVLSDMKREYQREHFCRIVDYMRKHVPGVYIATDFICAFPTETEADFEESLQLVRRYQFPSLFINQFYPRPGTPAARLRKINTVEARRRTAEMTRLFHSYRRYDESRIGEEHRVLICERASDGKHLVGHNKSYEHILVPDPTSADGTGQGQCSLLGKWALVRVVAVSKFYMRSELLNCGEEIAEEEKLKQEDGKEKEKKNANGKINEHSEQLATPLLAQDGGNNVSPPPPQQQLLRWAIVGLALFLVLKLLFPSLLSLLPSRR